MHMIRSNMTVQESGHTVALNSTCQPLCAMWYAGSFVRFITYIHFIYVVASLKHSADQAVATAEKIVRFKERLRIHDTRDNSLYSRHPFLVTNVTHHYPPLITSTKGMD